MSGRGRIEKRVGRSKEELFRSNKRLNRETGATSRSKLRIDLATDRRRGGQIRLGGP